MGDIAGHGLIWKAANWGGLNLPVVAVAIGAKPARPRPTWQ